MDAVIDQMTVKLCIAQRQLNGENLKWELDVTTT